MKMSRFSRDRVNRIIEAYDRGEDVVAPIAQLSWDELRLLVRVVDDRERKQFPELLTTLINIETEADLQSFRHEMLTEKEVSIPSNETILRLRGELRAVWGKPQREIEHAVDKWFDEVPIDPKQDAWLILHELGIIRPRNLAGSVARAMFQWHEYCFTCTNPACNGTRYVASRKDQKYCLRTEECAKYGHRAAALRHYRKQAKATNRKSRKGNIQ